MAMKSELGIKYDEWLASEQGNACLDPTLMFFTSKHEQLMRQKIECAFLAGAKANADVVEELCTTLLSATKNTPRT